MSEVTKSPLLEFWRTLKPALPRFLELKVPSSDYLLLRRALDTASHGRHKKFNWSIRHVTAVATSVEGVREFMLVTLYSTWTAGDDFERRRLVEDTLRDTAMDKAIPIMVLLHYKDWI